jgi:RNA polymerase sigma-70 factor, ECF subfamily
LAQDAKLKASQPERVDVPLASLMAAAQAGDQRAYKTLLKLAVPLIKRYVAKRLFDQGSCDDLCQDILLRIHAYRHTFDPKQMFESWMYSICRNALIDLLRARGRKKEALAFDCEDETALGSVDADGDAVIALRQAIAALPEDQRRTLELARVEGRSMQEVATKTGVSLSAAKVRAHRAFKAVRAAVLGDDD